MLLRDKPSLAMRLVTLYLSKTPTKRTLGSEEATETDRLKNRAKGAAAPRRAHHRRYSIEERGDGRQSWHLITPRSEEVANTIVYLHGGGYINPSVVQHWDLMCALAEDNRARVIAPTYTLAPEGNAELATSSLADLHEHLCLEYGHSPVWGGDSAGGGLALATAQVLRQRGAPAPAHLLLFAPWLDVRLDNPAIEAMAASDPTLNTVGLRAAGRSWAGRLPLDDPRVSPATGDPRGLPPITLVIGDRDLLAADCRDFASAALAAGVDLELIESPGAFHVFPAATFLPESKQVRRRLTARLREQTEGPSQSGDRA